MTSPILQAASVRFRTSIPPVLAPRALAQIPRGRRRRSAAQGVGWGAWTHNLITDAGLDMPASELWRNCFRYIAVGTGARVTKRDSGNVTATRAGTLVTASTSFFEEADVGRTIKLDTGAVAKVIAYNSGTSVTVADSGTDGASEFTLWYGNDSTHEAEVACFAGELTGPNERTTTVSGNVVTLRRTGISNAFATAKVLREIGWRPTPSGALFGRALIPGGGDVVAANQQYKVQVELSVCITPATPTAAGNLGTACDTSGTYCVEAFGFDANGASVQNAAVLATHYGTQGFNSAALEPSCSGREMTCTLEAIPPRALSTLMLKQGDYTYGAGVEEIKAYVAGSHRRISTYSINATTWAGTICGVRVGYGNNSEIWRHTFATHIVKTSLQTFSWDLTLAWDRVLVN